MRLFSRIASRTADPSLPVALVRASIIDLFFSFESDCKSYGSAVKC